MSRYGDYTAACLKEVSLMLKQIPQPYGLNMTLISIKTLSLQFNFIYIFLYLQKKSVHIFQLWIKVLSSIESSPYRPRNSATDWKSGLRIADE